MDPILVPSLLVGIALLLLFLGAAWLFRSRSVEITDRLEDLPDVPIPVFSTATSPLRARPGPLSRLLASGRAPDLATDLWRADLRLTPSEYVLINIASILIVMLISYLGFRGRLSGPLLLIGVALGGLLGALLPRWYLSSKQRQRLTTFEKQLPDTIILLANSLRSGYSLLQAMEVVSREMAAPVSVEFQRVIREIGLGLTMSEALNNMLRRMPSDDFEFIITAINIQYEVGGNLAQILDTIAKTIRERVRILGEIRVLTTQQRLSAVVLTILPIAVALLLFSVNPGYISLLWQTTCGLWMLLTAVALMILGFFLIQRVAQVKV